MLGTGTQTDPYIPETWDEFTYAVKQAAAYVRLPESPDVYDLNDIYPEGNVTIEINAASIEGNNWEIRNAYNVKFTSDASIDKLVKDLHFLNIYWNKQSSDWMIGVSYLSFYNCKFSGIIAGYQQSLFYENILRRCSVNVKFVGDSFNLVRNEYSKFDFCNIKIDHDNGKEIGDTVPIRCNNSFIEHISGKSGIVLTLTGNSSVVLSDSGNFVTTSTGAKAPVTEEQLKDAEYLLSIGFPVEY